LGITSNVGPSNRTKNFVVVRLTHHQVFHAILMCVLWSSFVPLLDPALQKQWPHEPHHITLHVFSSWPRANYC